MVGCFMNSQLDLNYLARYFDAYALRIGWTFYHSLWQGLVVAAILWIVRRAICRTSSADAKLRYISSMIALVAIPVLGLVTLITLAPEASPIEFVEAPSDAAGESAFSSLLWHEHLPVLYDLRSSVEAWIPTVSLLWVTGICFASLRLILGWTLVRRLVARACSSLDPEWQVRVDRLQEAMQIPRQVRILFSDTLQTPAVVGWLKPAILWPAREVPDMSPQEVSALLSHELAHVRRHDFIANAIQSIIEVFYFYHPAAWSISRQARLEREHCADELAVDVLESSRMGTRMIYGQTLLKLEEQRPAPAFAVRAAGGYLVQRIRRITGVKEPPASTVRLVAGVGVLGVTSLFLYAIQTAVRPILVQVEQYQSVQNRSNRLSGSATSNRDSSIITEPIAAAILARLEARRIQPKTMDALRKAMNSQRPMSIEQVYAILKEHGYNQDTLHGPPERAQAPTPSDQPTLVTEPIAHAIISRLSARRIHADALCAVRDAMWEAIREEKPLVLTQVHAILNSHGYDQSTLHSPPPR
jgi:beta-lactamase regulating signal transducer with metallopeptidase domain